MIDDFVGRDISQEDRDQMPEHDFAGKGRSFPIQKPEDVAAAAHSIGRAGGANYDAGTLKKNIIAIAKRKGKEFEAQLPDEWKKELEACDTPQVRMSDAGPRYFVRLGDLADGLKRIPVAILGSFVKGKQKFAITKATLADLVANFKKRAADTVIDYEHASEFPEAAAGQPIPAAGWIQRLDDQPDKDGILWGWADFTARARELLATKEYRYFSPVISWGARDKHSGEPQGATLESGALTNRPFLDEMPAIAMSERWKRIEPGDGRDKEAQTVKVKNVGLLDDRRVKVVLEDDTEAVSAEAIPSPKVVRLSDVKRDKEGRYDFASLPQDGETLIASDVLHGMRVQAALDAAVKDCKITPAQRPTYEKLALTDLAGFEGLMAGAKAKVDLREHGTSGEGLTSAAAVQAAIDAKIGEKMQARKMKYADALKLVASECADLFSLKQRFAQGGK